MKKVALVTAGLLLALGIYAQGEVNEINMSVMRARHAVDTLVQNDLVLQARLDSLETDTLYIGDVKFFYDAEAQTVASTTGVPEVTVQQGQEVHHPLVINNTADTLYDGTPVYTSSVSNGFVEIDSAKSSSPFTSLSSLGLVTADIAPGELGFVTYFGIVRGINTTGLTEGRPVYLAANGGLISTKPAAPNEIVLFGTCLVEHADTGKIDVVLNLFTRPLANKSYSFTSNGIGAGIYYVGGYYDAPLLDATIDEVTPTQAYGTAGNPYGAHAFVVAGGAGTVDAGQVGLRVIGTSGTDAGAYNVNDTAIITEDITTLSTDDYIETPEKWDSIIIFELYDFSGTPTAYSLDLNYGFCKYEDFGNVDFSVTKIEAVGLAGAADTNFDMSLLHHHDSGWTYAASGFIPGNGELADFSDTYSPNDNLANGIPFAWKVTPINQFIHGDADEGIIVRIVTGANNSVQSMDVHVIGVVESF